MKHTFSLMLILSLFLTVAHGQDAVIKTLQTEAQKKLAAAVKDTSTKVWRKGLLYSLTFSQASLNNWAAGGDKFSLSLGSVLNLYANYKKGKNSWDNSFDVNLGYVNSTSLGNRKNDDRFDLTSKYGYGLNSKLNFAVLSNFRSQFFKGYTYEGSKRTFTSNIMAPGYFLQSAGLDVKPNKNLSLFASPLTARWVFVLDDALSVRGLYGVSIGERSNFEVGAFATINFLKEIAPNIVYKTKLDLFSNYRNNPQNVDLFMSNLLSVKISKVFNVNWGVDFIYDDDARLFGSNGTSPALQFKSLIGLGVQFKR